MLTPDTRNLEIHISHKTVASFSARCYDTGHGFTFQISPAYSVMVRSLENLPEPAIFRIALRAQASGSAYNSRNRWSASR